LAPHRPQTGWRASAARSFTRFFAPHLGQVMIVVSASMSRILRAHIAGANGRTGEPTSKM
jgi:hypothetical protein